MTFDSLLASTTLAQAGAAAPDAPAATGTAVSGPTATGTAVSGPTATGTGDAQPAGNNGMMIMMTLALGGFALMMFFSGRKEKKKKAEMTARLQKGAKVTTIGQARGKVTEVTDTEVTIKFEDCSITFLKSAIASVDEVPA